VRILGLPKGFAVSGVVASLGQSIEAFFLKDSFCSFMLKSVLSLFSLLFLVSSNFDFFVFLDLSSFLFL